MAKACPTCGGSGTVKVPKAGFAKGEEEITCPRCNGSGKVS